ncbi:MAG: hypothetical protein VB124_05190, partial [Burkholderia sp.]
HRVQGPIQSRIASRKTGLQVTPRSPSGSALATCRLIAKSCLKNRIRYTSARSPLPHRPLHAEVLVGAGATPVCLNARAKIFSNSLIR